MFGGLLICFTLIIRLPLVTKWNLICVLKVIQFPYTILLIYVRSTV